ncbi:hypothetical protein J3S90_09240 [Flavobacterium sp. P4023]|uniref:Uncharacterized protein n=1 Tax=Flavobacterium flabelliforme TaxID=2816119 RepID=A0ABS5CTN9_9FLAO|nr:hypothetical protein [Flavobacterium flabelliforme]MBP4141986.1 hypothetical protein [Flavobacterium flabelliforme]
MKNTKSILAFLFSIMLLISSLDLSAQRKKYSGSKHSSSHGGHYSRGKGSSHKGGSYKNSSTKNHYGKHRK